VCPKFRFCENNKLKFTVKTLNHLSTRHAEFISASPGKFSLSTLPAVVGRLPPKTKRIQRTNSCTKYNQHQ
jgi:hypothetical protein